MEEICCLENQKQRNLILFIDNGLFNQVDEQKKEEVEEEKGEEGKGKPRVSNYWYIF